MAFIRCDFFSESLAQGASIHVLLPQRTSTGMIGMESASRPGPSPVLWLLHGLSDDHTIWMRRTSIERYAAERGLAVVMPAVGRSFYQNMHCGLRYFDYIAEELPRVCSDYFPLSDKREDNFIAGLSMGGYGAFLHAFSRPDKYAAAASLSGVLDISSILKKDNELLSDAEKQAIFGPTETRRPEQYDLSRLAPRVLQPAPSLRPKLYACCGTEDFLLEENRTFVEDARKFGLNLEYHEARGTHDWAFWDTWIRKIIKWLPVRKSA